MRRPKREPQSCTYPGCSVKRANYRGSDGRWTCARHRVADEPMRRLTMADVRRVAREQGGAVESDGVGGYEILAPDGRRWIDAEVQCYVLPLNEYEPEERQELIQDCIDAIRSGHEPYPEG